MSADVRVQMTTGASCISIIRGLTPIFRGTIVVHNAEFQQSITLEFTHSSAWKSLTFKNVVRNGVSSHLVMCMLLLSLSVGKPCTVEVLYCLSVKGCQQDSCSVSHAQP